MSKTTSTLPPGFSRNGQLQATDSTSSAIAAVLIFLTATLLICFCAYCDNIRNGCLNYMFWRCRDDPKRGKISTSHKYAFVPTEELGFTNDGFMTSTTTTPSPSYRNALVVGVPPYRKLTTLSAPFSMAVDDNKHHGAAASVNNTDFSVVVSKDSVISAV